MKVVIDCNVFISAGLGSKNCLEVIRCIDVREDLSLYVSKELLEEFVLVARRDKFFKYQRQLFELLANLLAFADHYTDIPPSIYVIPDKKDQMYIDLCAYLSCDYLVTGNAKHFPDSPYGVTAVLTPAEFLDQIKKDMSVTS